MHRRSLFLLFLLLPTGLIAAPGDPPPAAPSAFVGTVLKAEADGLRLTIVDVKTDGRTTVRLTDATRIIRKAETLRPADLTSGTRIYIQGDSVDGEVVARTVRVLPAIPAKPKSPTSEHDAASGVVKEVRPAQRIFVVAVPERSGRPAHDVSIRWDEKSRFVQGPRRAKGTELAVGQRVGVKGMPEKPGMYASFVAILRNDQR